jgi:eukaryotic-like serine/threonine-protein kinase
MVPSIPRSPAVDELPRVQELLDEIFESGCTPEELCADCPELLPEIRQRWHQMRALEAELDALFPTTAEPDPGARGPSPWQAGAELPRIPGYDVQELLGRGGMGIVYKARHLRLNRVVALKMLITGAYAAPRDRARFQREAEAVASLRHASIVQIYDVGEHDSWPYFTMEFLDGGSLAQTLAGTPQPARQAATLLATLAEAVQMAHSAGIVHRDLKPGNILLTATGIPKVADFGLARHLDGESAITLSGARIGTPSYMAPEQASAQPKTVGPAADIYSLGAVLYEMLTGRPPFRGETASETERQVLAEEPVPPSRLNAKVPRDLETICLKCLHKVPERRYATAAALADDLRRFQQNLPIEARPVGLFERALKWVHRHPTPTAMLVASLVLMAILVGAGQSLAVQRAHRRDAVEADLKELAALQDSARWSEARLALERAFAQLNGSGPYDLRRRLDQARRDLDFVMRLDAIRLKRVTRGELAFYKAQANREYATAFQQAGFGTIDDPPARVAMMIDASRVRDALVAAVHDWAVCATETAERGWLLEVARQTDSSAGGWRKRSLDPAAWEDRPALEELARTAPAASEPVSLLLALGERLRATGGDAAAFLRRVQREHPADFWANLIIGNATLQLSPQEAAGYYRAALASRPQAAVGYCAVGDTLRLQNWPDQAIDYYHKALQKDSGYVRAYSNIGDALQDQGEWDEAIDHYTKALQLDADYAWAHHNLANVLRVKGRLDQARDHYQQAIRVDPRNSEVQNGLRSVLLRQGLGTEVLVGWRKVLEANPPTHDAWSGYAELCLFLGEDEEYRRACRALIERFGATTSPYVAEPVGRALLLVPGADGESAKAHALVDRAVAAKASTPDWIYRYFLFAQGLAEYRRGRFSSAASLMQGEASRVLGPSPRLVLAMAQHGEGQREQARATLAKAVVEFDWNAAQADNRGAWIAHILRREAEALILPSLPAFLRGEYQPVDNDERLALVAICDFQGRYHASARLYADAVASNPRLADELSAACRARASLGDQQPVSRVDEMAASSRYPAARCAALAGCGLGKDGATLSPEERTRWRRQARAWLRADLAVWASVMDSGSRAAHVAVRKLLMHWQADPDLAGLREPSALDQLSADERMDWLRLWNEVAAVLDRTRRSE